MGTSAAKPSDPFGTLNTLSGVWGEVSYYSLRRLSDDGSDLNETPYTVKVLLENALRRAQGKRSGEVEALRRWRASNATKGELSFLPARVLLQDFTGVPAVVDLAAMRAAVARSGGDPRRINPLAPVDLVIDHSVQVDYFGSTRAFDANVDLEYERNAERYALLRWAQNAFENVRVVPPGTGIVHQVNLEYLATVVAVREVDGLKVALPDTLVGTDSHTTMVNGLGVLGWGVGGIEAEAVMLGQPLYLPWPVVVGVRLTGRLPEGSTATDLVLRITAMLRQHGVVEKFVEFTGPGIEALSLPDRATVSNMAPEYGATAALFPIDRETLRYLRATGRDEASIKLVERYAKEQALFHEGHTPEPSFSELLELDLGTVQATMAGPRRPQDSVPLAEAKHSFRSAFAREIETRDVAGKQRRTVEIDLEGIRTSLAHGSVAIAAITSCTNTSNPSVLVAAGLLAKKAVERGLTVKPHVKTSLAPGSRTVTDYLRDAGLTPYLEALRFHLVGYGCTTCIGNSGPLREPVAEAVRENDLVVAAVLSGNRNFEGRIHPQVRASYLASPPLVVAYALAGTVDIDLTSEPLGRDPNGQPVFLREIWPSSDEIAAAVAKTVRRELFVANYSQVTAGDDRWADLKVPSGDAYDWDLASTYVQEPPFFKGLAPDKVIPMPEIAGARALAVLGHSVTTDHISPAGSIPKDSPAGTYLMERGVRPAEFNSFGARRGNHEVMMRGTFGNIRLRNALVPSREGDWTAHLPDGAEMRIFDAAVRYGEEGVPLLVIAGREYGSGSSRDWAAKGAQLLGVRAVIAESYERIHRSNLVGMGVLPLEFRQGETLATYGLNGRELFGIRGVADGLVPGASLTVRAEREDGSAAEFSAIARLDNAMEVHYYRNGGVLQTVLRNMMREVPGQRKLKSCG